MTSLGAPEILVIFFTALFWLLPLAGLVWGLVTLHRVRAGVDDVRRRLEAIERLLQTPRSG